MAYRLRRYLQRQYSKLFHRVDCRSFGRALSDLGLRRGDLVCVHSELSRVGYVVGGADMLIDTVTEAVGDEGTVMMPSFPTAGSAVRYVDSGATFDVRTSPSKVGLLTEVFRRRPGVRRSAHPTNAVCAWGRQAGDILRDHESSPTPYGYETPYGRLAEADNGRILLLGVPILTLLHHLQERVAFPGLFLPGSRSVDYVDWGGETKTMQTRVITPRVAYFVAVPSREGTAPDWAILHDFALMFPKGREEVVRAMGYRFEGYTRLWERRGELERRGVLRATRLGKEEIGLVETKAFIGLVEPELRALIERFRDHYDHDRIAALNLPYS